MRSGPMGIAVAFLFLWIFVDNRIVKTIFGLLLLAWFGWMIWAAISTREWIILIMPGFIIIAWALLSGLKNTFAPED